MGTRAHYFDSWLDSEGEPVANGSVYVCDEHTEDLISETIYGADSDHPADSADEQDNPLVTANDGSFYIWLAAEQRVTLRFEKNGEQTTERIVDVSKNPTTGLTVQDESSDLTNRNKLAFLGAGVTAADDSGNSRTTVTIPGGITGITVAEGGTPLDTDISTIDFDGSDFNLTESPENEVNVALNYGTGAGQPAQGNDARFGVVGDLLDWQFVRKTSDESIVSSTTLQDDDQLAIAIGSGQTWRWTMLLFYGGNDTTADLKLTFSVPTDGTGRWSGVGTSETDTAILTTRSAYGDANAIVLGTSNGDRFALLGGILRGMTAAGTFQFRFAQNTSGLGTVAVRSDTVLLMERLS